MKKTLIFILFLTATSIASFAGGIKEKHLVGTWSVADFKVEVEGMEEGLMDEVATQMKTVKLNFEKNHDYVIRDASEELESGTWTLSKSEATLSLDASGDPDIFKVESLSKKNAVITLNEGEMTMTLVLTKD